MKLATVAAALMLTVVAHADNKPAEQTSLFSPTSTAPSTADIELWTLMLDQAMREHTRADYGYILIDRTVPSSRMRTYVMKEIAASAPFDAFLKRNDVSIRVKGLPLPSNVQLMDADHVVQVPKTIFIRLSLPAFSRDGAKALTYHETTTGLNDTQGNCYEWEKRNGRWEIVGSPCGWIN